MSTPIDLKKLEQKVFKASIQDGIMEMYAGLFLAFYGGCCNAASTYFEIEFSVIPLVFVFVFSGAIIELIRRRLTYPRTGCARIKARIKPIFLVLVILPMMLFPIFLAILARFFAETQNFDLILKWTPLFLAVVFGLFFYGLAIRSGSARYYAFLVLSVIGGIVLSLIRFSPARTGMTLFFLGLGGALVLDGVAMLIHFLHKYPKATKEGTNVSH